LRNVEPGFCIKNMSILSRNSTGMTLVEVLVSLALVTIAIGSMIALITQSSVFSRRVDRVYTASYLGQRRIDLLKKFDFDQLASTAETDIRISSDGNISENGNYVRTTEVVTNFNDNVYLAKVKVSVRKIKINMDGTVLDPETGEMTFLGEPIVMETLFSDVQ